jgi:hypothetical protein
LSNTTFQNYDDIIERSCQAWNEILSENGFIKNLCSREWSFLVDTSKAQVEAQALADENVAKFIDGKTVIKVEDGFIKNLCSSEWSFLV